MALINKLTAIADAIRAKTGGSSPLSLDDMATAIAGISGGGSEGLNDDFHAFVEQTNPQLSFTTYRSNGTAIKKQLSGTNITDIDMPNLIEISAQIPINNVIARKLEQYPLTSISTGSESAFLGRCDKLELVQNYIAISSKYNEKLRCYFLAIPYSQLKYINDGFLARSVYWAPEEGTTIGNSNNKIDSTKTLILTREDKIVTLKSLSYCNPNMNVYVPASLLNSYKSATNWSTIADQIFAIENSENVLKGVFTGLDSKYGWSGELTLLQRLQRQSALQGWLITYDELITIANDLADNGENSVYYNYKDNLIINCGLPITDNINLFITDTFKYKDANDELIPLSGLLVQKEQFLLSRDNQFIGLFNLWGPQKINSLTTNVGGFGESELYHKLNDSDGSLFTMLPTSLTNNLVEWKIDNNHTALLAPPSEKEIFGTNTYGDSSYDIYDQLAFFADTKINKASQSSLTWTRSPNGSNMTTFCFINSYGVVDAGYASNAIGLAPAIALGKKGVNNG